MELPPYVDDPAVYATVGVGLPAIAHAEVGFLPHPRLGVELRGSWVIFNPMVGLAVDGAVWTSTGGARGHAVTGHDSGCALGPNATIGVGWAF